MVWDNLSCLGTEALARLGLRLGGFRVFETVLQRCIAEGLVGGEAFAIDASLIKADANRQKGIEGEKGLPPEATGRAVKEYMAVLDDEAFGAATDVVPKFVSPADPGSAMDRSPWRTSILRLFHQLSDRCRQRHYC